jgi:hypothetical protein
MAVVAFSDFSAILDSTGEAWAIAGAALTALSAERPSLCSGTAGIGCDLILAAVKTPDGFGVAEGFCSESLPKKLAARTPPTTNTPIAAGKIPKRRFFFFSPDRESSLVMGVPAVTAAVKLGE